VHANKDSAAVSVSDTGVLTYLGGSYRRTDSRLSWFDRSGKRITDEGMIGQESPFALSPDQKTVALVRRLHAEQASRPSVYPAGTRVSASDSV